MEYGARRRRDLVPCLNWTGTSRKQRKPLQFNEKQLAAIQRDELFLISSRGGSTPVELFLAAVQSLAAGVVALLRQT